MSFHQAEASPLERFGEAFPVLLAAKPTLFKKLVLLRK